MKIEGQEEDAQVSTITILYPFDYFLLILKTAFFWKQMRFEQMEKEYLTQRIEFLNAGDMAHYKQLVIKMHEVDAVQFESVLSDLYVKLGIEE